MQNNALALAPNNIDTQGLTVAKRIIAQIIFARPLMGAKTVGKIARDFQVHPVQVTQWKGVLKARLPQVFEAPNTANDKDSQETIAELHEKIGRLTMEADWLKKKCKQLGV